MPTTFTLRRFNPIRFARGAPAAEVEVSSEEGSDLLWMTTHDIANNMEDFMNGANDISGLLLAREHYRTRKAYP